MHFLDWKVEDGRKVKFGQEGRMEKEGGWREEDRRRYCEEERRGERRRAGGMG